MSFAQGGLHDERQFIMARTKGPSRKPVTVGLSEGVYAAAEEARWAKRMSFSEYVNHAVGQFLAAEGITVTEPEASAETPVEKDAKPAQKA